MAMKDSALASPYGWGNLSQVIQTRRSRPGCSSGERTKNRRDDRDRRSREAWRPVFADSGIFIAFLDRSDHYHQAAVRLFADPPRRWYTSLAVVSETYGWFLHRLGEESARTFRLALADLPRLELLALDAAHHAAVGRTLDRFRARKLTYVDASSLVFLAERRIREVWGTDRDLAIDGARVVP